MVETKIQVIKKKSFKSLSMSVERDGTVVVKAPLTTTDEEIKQFVEENRSFIRRVIEKYKEYGVFKEYRNGEKFLYLGREYELRITDQDQKEPLILKDNYFYLLDKHLDNARGVFLTWYKREANKIISERVKYYAKVGNFSYNKINIKDLQKVWGSCSSRKNLSFNWRIVMAPLDVIDYVVVHELTHTREFSHGRRFWAEVEKFIPDYNDKELWLKRNGHLLDL